MPNKSKVVVLKFGSSVLRSEADLPSAVHEIYRWWREGSQVITVASAFGGTTDELMRQAERICDQPDKSLLPNLLATGEATAAALLALTLKRVGIPVRLFDESQARLCTVGGHIDAMPIAVDSARLLSESRRSVVVIPGFVGRDEHGERTLLGRGGSDLTALFLAHRLRAHCVLVKDVDGIYTSDPAHSTARASRFLRANYETALRFGGPVVQAKAVRFAAANKVRFTITSIGTQTQTEVGPFDDCFDGSGPPASPLRVTLLGCGTVGGGVYQRLAELPHLFEVVGVGSRTSKRAHAVGVPERLATIDIDELLAKRSDVVVELIGTTNYATQLATATLRSHRHFVTANKALMAVEGELIESLASDCGVSARYSAAVGGVLPALEAVERIRRITGIKAVSGILNGTTNFVLDRVAEGTPLSKAIAAAQHSGYAEANPAFDLDGTDATQKLILLTKKAFGVTVAFNEIKRVGISEGDVDHIREARRRGRTVRLVAQCIGGSNGLSASVNLVELGDSHPLAHVSGAGNRLIVEPEDGDPLIISGIGAGRWPTTEAVMADLLDLRREQTTAASREFEALEVCA